MMDFIPENERPRERCLRVGAHSLSLRECLALILGSGPKNVGCLGIAQKILQRHSVSYAESDEARAFFLAMEISPQAHLSRISGLGDAGVARILAAFELGRKYFLFKSLCLGLEEEGIQASKKQRPTSSPSFSSHPSKRGLSTLALSKISEALRCEAQEWLGFIPIYRNCKVGDLCLVDRGARTHVNTDPTEFFSKLLALRPQSFFLAHNHPSGTLHASLQDMDLTVRIADLSSQLGIQCLGHWIVTPNQETWIEVPSI